MTTTITVSNHKGGVAKTTTAWMLARHLRQNFRVLLIDMDPRASLTKLSGAVAHAGSNINQVLGGANRASASLRQAAVMGDYDIDIVPSDMGLANTAYGLQQRMFGRHDALAQAITYTGGAWDFIIIDSPPSADVLAINAIAPTDLLIIPSQPEEGSIEAVAETLDLARQTANATNKGFIPYMVIGTMIEAMTNQHQAGMARLSHDHSATVYIPKRKGMDADAQLFDAYETLAHRILNLTQPTEVAA
jgi:chromosome partitioning protein